MKLGKKRVFALTIVFATLLSVQCADKEGPIVPYVDTEPPPYLIGEPVISPARVEPGEHATVVVVLTDRDGAPVPDHEVVFATDLGGFVDVSMPTDEAGIATAVFIAPSSTGMATITIRADGATTRTSVVQVGQGALSISPASIIANGMATALIEVALVDAAGDPVPDASVVFSTDRGSIIDAASRTDGYGIATATLVSAASKLDMVASVGAVISYGSIRQTETAACLLRGVTISVAADPMEVPADGVSTSQIAAQVRETTSGAPLSYVSVSFRSSLGAIGGSATADANGIARAVLTSSASPGVATVKGVYGGLSDSTQVAFGTLNLLLTATEESMVADGMSSQYVIATLLTQDNNPVAGVKIDFSTNHGVVAKTAITDSRGRAGAILTSSQDVTTARVIASFKGTYRDTVYVGFQNAVLGVKALPMVIKAKPANSVSIVTRVVFGDGSPVPDSTAVAFSTTQGTITARAVTLSGISIAQLRPNGAADDQVIVTAICGNASGTTQVMFTPDVPAQITCHAVPDTVASGGTAFSTIVAVVTDAYGNPVEDGALVAFTIMEGNGLVAPSGLTSAGIATARFTPSGGGIATVEARCELASAEAGVVVLSQSPGAIIASPDTAWIAVGEAQNRTQAVITASVFDSYMNPVDDGTEVSFEILYGPGGGEYIDDPAFGYGPVMKETSGGMASVTVNSGTKAGTLLMTISAGEHVATAAKVGISAGLPDSIFITTGDIVTGNDGVYVEAVSAIVRDKYNNPVEDGTAVYFTLDRPDVGAINPEAVTGGLFPCMEFTGTPSKGVTHACLKFPTSSMNKAITIMASCGTLESGFPTSIPTVLPVTIGLDAVPSSINGTDGGDVYVYVSLRDVYDLPVENACVRFSVAGPGTLFPYYASTDMYGTATAVLTIPAGTAATTATIKAKLCMSDVEKEVDITITE